MRLSSDALSSDSVHSMYMVAVAEVSIGIQTIGDERPGVCPSHNGYTLLPE